MIRIEIRNFQSIETVDLEINGYAALVGSSNIGKSAVIRAVRAVLANTQGGKHVRHGAACLRRLSKVKTCKCKASVRLVGDGYDILWEKGDADNRYTVNGAVYDAVPKGFPDFLRPWFQPIKVSDQNVLLQVASQFDPMFLLNASGPAVADVLSDVAQLDQINVASRLCEKDRRDVMATIKVRDSDAKSLRDRLSFYAGLDGTVSHVETVTSQSVELLRKQGLAKRLAGLCTSQNALQDSIDSLTPVVSQPTPSATPVSDVVKKLAFLRKQHKESEAQRTVIAFLQPVEEVSLPDPIVMQRKVTASSNLLGWLGKLRDIKTTFARHAPLKDLPDLDTSRLIKAAELSGKVGALLERHAQLSAALVRLSSECDRLGQEETALHQELGAFDTCPLCEQPFGSHP